MGKFETLEDALQEELKDLYSAEKQILKALPKVIKVASTQSLKKGLEAHRKETEKHISRIEEIGTILSCKLSGKVCEAMKGILAEAEDILKQDWECESVHDQLIIGASQRVEHYEMAAYGSARAMAKTLGLTKVAKLLDQTLQEERVANKSLIVISEKHVLENCTTRKSLEELSEIASNGNRMASSKQSRSRAAARQ